MNCFVFLASVASCVWAIIVCYLLRCLGKWAAPQDGGGDTARCRCRRGPRRHHRPCFAHTCGAELFYHPPQAHRNSKPAHAAARNRELAE